MKLKIKGINEGVLITLPDGTWEECCASVIETIRENTAFFSGANLFLDAGFRDLRVTEISALRSELEACSVTLRGIYGTSQKTRQNCVSLGLEVNPAAPRPGLRKKDAAKSSKATDENAAIIPHTLRSGTSVRKEETVLVLGDVNAGAEIYSDRSVVVWGIVRGRVCAGASGDKTASIYALGFENAQVSVNDIGAFIEKKQIRGGKLQPSVVRIVDNEIVIEAKGK